jgi:hypothetical protein
MRGFMKLEEWKEYGSQLVGNIKNLPTTIVKKVAAYPHTTMRALSYVTTLATTPTQTLDDKIVLGIILLGASADDALNEAKWHQKNTDLKKCSLENDHIPGAATVNNLERYAYKIYQALGTATAGAIACSMFLENKGIGLPALTSYITFKMMNRVFSIFNEPSKNKALKNTS